MDCPAIREHLPEFTLGTLDAETARRVERHLAWCAGCRTEALELAEGASLLGHALPPAQPPSRLEARVSGLIGSLAERARRPRRRRRLVAAGVLAASLSLVGALGWAVAMTERAEDAEVAATTATRRAEEFEALVAEILRDAPDGNVRSADLLRVTEAPGGGRVIVSDSPGGYDWILIVAGSLDGERGPHHSFALTADGRERIGQLHPASPGEVAAYRIFEKDVSRVRSVWVTDGRGNTVLRAKLTRV
ncbi:MAG TPA: anti-sigma factor [Actinomycetota bacterium]|nr:anti-sigma factor [Actinomycetota bacterium]